MRGLTGVPTVLPRGDKLRAIKLRQNEDTFQQQRDHILSTLLRVLQALPMQLIGECQQATLTAAVNSFPGLSKIRYVASTLLGDFEENSPSGDQASQRSFRALTYLRER